MSFDGSQKSALSEELDKTSSLAKAERLMPQSLELSSANVPNVSRTLPVASNGNVDEEAEAHTKVVAAELPRG